MATKRQESARKRVLARIAAQPGILAGRHFTPVEARELLPLERAGLIRWAGRGRDGGWALGSVLEVD